ncbi:hypothetical protein SAMN05421690_102831 [Nitrosomonas sp. Nm51]|uniref:helix-turn-helix domain-containing protein n=1 Tax=Nitrosomonas sp. Nm51 TaxID=133720 RepID=UPI0008D7C9E7|nr:helix-turn-helix transcriptional regulator [Nitrosomonas sp. Nm51]SER46229.1 hypothetical protein SAMN05421690_102831 [Nitrosomonas sp. Nm51]
MYSLFTPQDEIQIAHTNYSKHTKTFVVLSTVLFGTGSAYAMDSLEKWRSHLQPRVTLSLDQNETPSDNSQQIDTRTVIEHIENIRSILDPSISDLANLFNVSRQSVYKWLSGKYTPESENLKQLYTLSHIADKFKVAEISRANFILKMKAFNGLSLLDMLKSGEDCSVQVDMLISEAKAMEESYSRSGIASSKTKPTNDWKASISIPSSDEEI